MTEPLRYVSGEEIRRGDRIRFQGKQAEIEFSACELNDPDPEHLWFVQQYGGGVMVKGPSISGLIFIPVDQLKNYEDLVFIAREESENAP